MAPLRIVLDTNVLLSGIAYPASIPGKIVTAWRHGAIEVILSSYILEELRRVLPRLENRHGMSADEIDDLIDILALQAEVVDPAQGVQDTLRDPKDIPVLGTLIAARDFCDADYLITGDKDLLAAADNYPIMTPAGFWSIHGGL